MTIIVGNFEQGVLITDRFVIEFQEIAKSIRSADRMFEDKHHFTPDGYFLYVFDFKQEETVTDLILNHIRAHEDGTLDKDFELVNPEKKRVAMYVVTARAAYTVFANEGSGNIKITKTSRWFHNSELTHRTLDNCRLTAEEIFDIVVASETTANGQKNIINFKGKLKLIPKKRKTKKVKEETK